MINARSTKADLLGHIASLDAQLITAGRTLAALREQLALQPALAFVPQSPAMHKAYYEYVRTQRVIAKARGQRVVGYKTFSQWSAA